MHISVEKSAFVKVLLHCQNVVEKKSTLPILSHILIDARDNMMSVCATDLDVELMISTPVEVRASGKTAVSATLLYDIVKKLSDKAVVELFLQESNSRLVITSGRSRFEVSCLDTADFPNLSKSDLSHNFELPVPVLRDLIETTRPFISNEETRYNMSGIYFHYHEEDDNQYLRAVSSDMHRLACVQCPAPDGAKDCPAAIVARKAINEVFKLLEDAKDKVKIGLSTSRIEIQVVNDTYSATFTSRLVDAVFPAYDEALHVADDKKLIVNTKEFTESIDRVGSVVNLDKLRAVKLLVNDSIAVVSAVSQELGSAQEDIDVFYSSDESVEVCCNIRYMIEAMQQIKTEETELLLQDENSSILMRPVNDQSRCFILMPMHF